MIRFPIFGKLLILLVVMGLLAPGNSLSAFQDRFVWLFGWSLRRDQDVQVLRQIIERAAKHGYNGAVLSANLDILCKQPPEYFRRLQEVKAFCEHNGLELIPSVFSIGYGGGVLSHNRNLAEGLPVKEALFIVREGRGLLLPDPPVRLVNGGFEELEGNRFRGWNFHDEPGVVSFPDHQIVHSGKTSIRMENFSAQPAGNARVMQEVKVHPYRCYRVSLWVRTEGLRPSNLFRILVLAGDRDLAPRQFDIPPSSDWRKVTLLFNSLGYDSVRLYAGVWGGREGKVWLDDVTLEEVGPINVLRRPGTPVTVRSEEGNVIYEEGKDYAPLVDPDFNFYNVDREAPSLQILKGSCIREGQWLRVSWYHPMVIYQDQVTVCMAEPELYEIFDHEAQLLAKYLHPKRILLSMDEVRMGGTCKRCEGKSMARLLGECVTKEVQILRKYNPKAQIYIWSDMLDPHHNAHSNYYLVQGDFTGSWNYVPKDLVIAVWGGEPRENSLRFFASRNFQTLIACYYDADTLKDVEDWLALARKTPQVRGLMYTTWLRRYDLLEEFGDLLNQAMR